MFRVNPWPVIDYPPSLGEVPAGKAQDCQRGGYLVRHDFPWI